MSKRRSEIEPIADKRAKQVTFYKRNSGLVKKAHELSVLCDGDVLLVTFSPSGRMLVFSNRSPDAVLQRYQEHVGQRQVLTSKALMSKQAACTGRAEPEDEDEEKLDEHASSTAASGVQLPSAYSEPEPQPSVNGTAIRLANPTYAQSREVQAPHQPAHELPQAECVSVYGELMPHAAYPVQCCAQGGSGYSYYTGAQQAYSPAYIRNYQAAAANSFAPQRCAYAVPHETSISPSRAYLTSSHGQPSSQLSTTSVAPLQPNQYQAFDAVQASCTPPVLRHPVEYECGYASQMSLAPATDYEVAPVGHWHYTG
mmetsp:Transcript_22229/g.48490  ORF Transcript_22229/g.48490 Transcript_22229/m.48490 type:complete len:312 (-) Transcript_22229:1032-1967(-)